MSYRLLLALGVAGVLALFGLGCIDTGGQSALPGNVVTLQVLDTANGVLTAPQWVAFQDGVNGTWQVLAGGQLQTRAALTQSGGVYQVAVTDPAGAYSFAVAATDEGRPAVTILRSTLAETTTPLLGFNITGTRLQRGDAPRWPSPASRRTGSPSRSTGTWTMAGSVTNAPADANYLYYGNGLDSDYMTAAATYTLDFAPNRPSDCLLYWATYDPTETPGALYVRRNISRAAGSTLTTNIDCTTDCTPVTQRDTFTPPVHIVSTVEFLTERGARLALASAGGGAPLAYPLIPAAAQVDTDRYVFSAWATSYCMASVYSHDTDATVVMPDPFTCSYSSASPPTFSGLATTGAVLYEAYFCTSTQYHSVLATAGWLRAADATSVALLDLTGLSGWNASWTLPAELEWAQMWRYDYTTTLDFLLRQYMPGYPGPVPAEDTYIQCDAYDAPGYDE